MSIVSTMLELQLSGLKSILFYPEDQKIFLSGFLCSKEQISKRSIFLEKPWTNPLHNVDFSKFFRTYPLWSKKHSFLSRISKIFLSAFCCSKKKHMRKRSIFWQKPWTNPFKKCRYFLTLLEIHFSGLKRILFYPEYQKIFLSGYFC